MSDILKNDLSMEHDVYQSRTVRLSAQYGAAIQETLANLRAYDFDATGATVYVLNSDGKNKSFHLDGANMDALMEAWIDFRIDLATAKEAEEQRKAGVLAQAMALAETVPGLHVSVEKDGERWKEDGVRWYAVHDWLHLDYHYAYSPDSLLTLVQEVQQKYYDTGVYAYDILDRLRTVQRDIDRKAERETHKAQPVAAEQGQHGDYSDLF